MMKAIVGENLFSGYKVGDGIGVMISHKNWAKIRSLKVDLIIFEVISGLKVNFHESPLVRVNVSNSWLVEASTLHNCKIGSLPFSYLGLPTCGDSHKLNFWSLLVNHSKSRLSI